MIEHKSLINYIRSIYSRYDDDISPYDKCFSVASISFDASIVEIFLPLFYGAALSIYDEPKIMDLKKMCRRIADRSITFAFLPPTILSDVCKELKKLSVKINLNKMLVGVESIKHDTLMEYLHINPEMKILVGYGPTETTICSTFYRFEPENKMNNIVPIGKPIYNTYIYLLDKNRNLVPQGEIGEICIGGLGLARGYYKKGKLTEEKFTDNPFIENEKIYNTGDKARWLPDGNLFFEGRKDRQLKIRGYRIEPGEIETRLLKFSDITKVIVTDKIIDERNFLCAYYTSKKDISSDKFRKTLSKDLPDHMIPTYFIKLDIMPKTPNGKLDIKALPLPDECHITAKPHMDAKTDREKLLKNIWEDVLGEKNIGINDNFFEMGGDSIGAIQVCAKLYEHGFKVETKDIYENPEISMLSPLLIVCGDSSEETVTGETILSPIQRWFMSRKELNHNHFNQSVMLYREEGFDRNIINEILNKIVLHHDILRASIIEIKGTYKLLYGDTDKTYFKLSEIDIRNRDNRDDIIKEHVYKANSEHNINGNHLMNLIIFKTCSGDHLLISINHLIIDAVSWRILLNDFADGYNAHLNNREFKLGRKTSSYKTWSERLYTDDFLDRQNGKRKYWEAIENIEIKPLSKDFITDEQEMKHSNNLIFNLESQYTINLIKEVNAVYNTNINDILIAALGKTFTEWTSENEILINTEGHGRDKIADDIDITNTIGWFTTSYPMILKSPGDRGAGEYLKFIKESIRAIPYNGIGYNVLKFTDKNDSRKFQDKLKPEIGFNYLGIVESTLNRSTFTKSEHDPGPMICPDSKRLFVFDINADIIENILNINVNYNRLEYKTETVMNIFNDFLENIKLIINHCMQKEDIEKTASDYGDLDLTTDELNEINSIITEI